MSEKRTKHRISGKKQKKLRVAAYCRVSTLMDAQDTSFELQCEHYRGYITGREDYELVGVYGDHGKSGRKMDGRPELGRLLADCEAGRIDLILTKSIARFSRNMRECVATIRRLQTLGVRVFFEKEGIDTSEPRNELLFHLMATIAEEESNSIGRNLMTAHEMRNRSGNPFWQRKYGYKKGADGEWIPDERPAAKVRSAFCMACAGYSVGSIRRMLIRMEDADPSGKKWYAVDVSMLLRNVLYKGDYLTQKTIRNADGTGRTKNRGEREQYYLEGHHTPLVPPEVFDHVQRLLESKTLWENRRRKAAKKQKQGKADGGGAFAGAMEKAPVFEEGGLLLAGRYGGQDYLFKGEHADGALEVRAENDGTDARAASPGEPGVRGGSLPETEGGGNA